MNSDALPLIRMAAMLAPSAAPMAIAQRRLGWSETTPDAVIECLDALKQLALAPADD